MIFRYIAFQIVCLLYQTSKVLLFSLKLTPRVRLLGSTVDLCVPYFTLFSQVQPNPSCQPWSNRYIRELQMEQTQNTSFTLQSHQGAFTHVMATICRLQNFTARFPKYSQNIRPIQNNLRWRSTTVISTVDDKTQLETAKDTVLDFDDPKQAFKSKTTWEILRALTVFKICSVDFIVDRQQTVSCFQSQLHFFFYSQSAQPWSLSETFLPQLCKNLLHV